MRVLLAVPAVAVVVGVVLLPMYFMIGVWGGEERQYASIKFFLYTLFGSALMIVAFLALYFLSGEVTLPDG